MTSTVNYDCLGSDEVYKVGQYPECCLEKHGKVYLLTSFSHSDRLTLS